MRTTTLAALGAATMIFATPAVGQEVPMVPGDFWEVAEIDVNDGQFSNYADYLAEPLASKPEFAKSKGWIKDYMVFAVQNARAGEPDLYLVSITIECQPRPRAWRARRSSMPSCKPMRAKRTFGIRRARANAQGRRIDADAAAAVPSLVACVGVSPPRGRRRPRTGGMYEEFLSIVGRGGTCAGRAATRRTRPTPQPMTPRRPKLAQLTGCNRK